MINLIEKFKSLFGKSELDSKLEDRIQTRVENIDEDTERIARWSDDIANTTTTVEFEKDKPRFYGEK